MYAFDRISRFGGRVAMEAGTYTLWLDGDCMSCEGNHPEEYRAVDTLVIRAEDGGGPVEVRPSPNDWLYNTGSREGRALYVLAVPEAGTFAVRYDLDTSSPKWENRAPAALAFGRGAGLPVRIVRPMVLLAGGGLGVASALSLVTFWRRRRFYERRYAVSDR